MPKVDAEKSTKSVLPYATPAAARKQQSPYAAAALYVSIVSLVWLPLTMAGKAWPFDESKNLRIGTAAAFLGFTLSIAACLQPNRKRAMAFFSIAVAGCVLLVYSCLPTIES